MLTFTPQCSGSIPSSQHGARPSRTLSTRQCCRPRAGPGLAPPCPFEGRSAGGTEGEQRGRQNRSHLKLTTGPTSEKMSFSCSSVASYGMFPTAGERRRRSAREAEGGKPQSRNSGSPARCRPPPRGPHRKPSAGSGPRPGRAPTAPPCCPALPVAARRFRSTRGTAPPPTSALT